MHYVILSYILNPHLKPKPHELRATINPFPYTLFTLFTRVYSYPRTRPTHPTLLILLNVWFRIHPMMIMNKIMTGRNSIKIWVNEMVNEK